MVLRDGKVTVQKLPSVLVAKASTLHDTIRQMKADNEVIGDSVSEYFRNQYDKNKHLCKECTCSAWDLVEEHVAFRQHQIDKYAKEKAARKASQAERKAAANS
jgi:hypothetical protein